MPPQSTSTSTETDILLNKTNIALARSQRIVSSWLPPLQTEDSTTNDTRKSDAEIQKEEDEIFTAVPERLGLGASLPNPESNISQSTEQATDDKLKKQLLGRNYKRVLKDMERDRSSANTPVSANSTAPVIRGDGDGDDGDAREVDDEEDDEDEGRTSLIGNKNRNKNQSQTEMKASSVKKMGKKKRKGNTHTHTHTHTDMDPGLESRLPISGQTQPDPGDFNGDGDGNDDDDEPESKSKPAPAKRKKATSFLDQVLGERAKKRKR